MSFFSKIPFVSTVFAVLCRFRFFYTAVRILKLIFRTKMCPTIFCQLQFFCISQGFVWSLFLYSLQFWVPNSLIFYQKNSLVRRGLSFNEVQSCEIPQVQIFWHQFVISLTGLLAEWNTVITTGQILYWNNLWLRHQQVWSVEVLPAGRGQY